jgi:hypothetical protein
MPIKPEYRHFYGKTWRTVTRPRILERAGNCCESCLAPNGVNVFRLGHNWARAERKFMEGGHWVRIVLTIAHLNHVAGDDRDANLMALCQHCHLHYDLHHHAESRATRKDLSRPILKELAG